MTANPSKPKNNEKPRIPSSEARKANKPLMEKRRRARINKSLGILKTLIVDTSREKKPTKLEKADILEFTVSYLQKNQTKSPDLTDKRFAEGYQECTKAALKFLESCNIEQSTLEKLVDFLRCRQQSSSTNTTKTNCTSWGDFSTTQKSESGSIFNVNDKCLGSLGSPSDLDCSEAQKNKSLTFTDDQASFKLGVVDPQQSDGSEIYIPLLDLNRSRIEGPLDIDNSKPRQLGPVDLSKLRADVSFTFSSPFDYVKNANSSNGSSISSACEIYNLDQPLNLCSKYSSMECGHSVWRPW